MTRRRAPLRPLAWAVPLLAVLLVAAGCAGIDDPDGWAPPTLADDTLYLTVDSGEIIAANAETFDRIWIFPEADEQECGDEGPKSRDLDGLYGAPAIEDGVVYVGAWDGYVYALDAESGECLWDFRTNDPIISGVVVDSGRVYVASTDKNLYVLDADSGSELDRTHVGDAWSTPLLLDGTLYVGTMNGELHALDAQTLESAWDSNFKITAGLLTDPRAIDGSIIVGGIGGKLYAVDAHTGEEQWSFGDADNWFWGAVAIDEDAGVIFATNMDSNIYALDAATGEIIWRFEGEALFRAGAAIAGDTVIAVDDDGFVFGLDAATGELVWNGPSDLEESTFATPLVLDEERVLIVARNGDVFTVSIADGRLVKVRINS